MATEVRHNPDQSRYEVFTDEQLAGFAQYLLEDGRITVFHTEIHPVYEGTGLAGTLARGVLEDARAQDLAVEPLCPFMLGYIRRHRDQYLDLVIPTMRDEVTSGGGAV